MMNYLAPILKAFDFNIIIYWDKQQKIYNFSLDTQRNIVEGFKGKRANDQNSHFGQFPLNYLAYLE